MKATEEGLEEAARIVLNSDDIRIVQPDASKVEGEADRIKTLGEFAIEIQPKGASSIQRTIRVNAEET